ncbi:ATP-binding protein [Treponema zioleckii]|uniref:ATP-binding protein n=1 Tax=Treponema zioleckii TaxID=331680 RepID=UPI00168A4802|nr:ATP-binding protein [Treponema zioleckii]
MPDFYVKNNSDIEINENLIEKLTHKICDWQKKNDFTVCLLIRKSSEEKLFLFSFEKSVWEKLEKSPEPAKLRLIADNELKNFREEFLGKLQFVFFVGYQLKDIEKIPQEQKKVLKIDGKTRLSIVPTEPKFSFSQVILPDETQRQIDDVVSLLENMQKIYFDWGFSEIDPIPRSVINFWGAPGTGKTMTVHAIAKQLGKKLLILNYADIESKYVGEAPKNLVAAFDLAQKEDAIIFFDEADSFLGKRIKNVDSGSEQSINSLRSQMLMKLEEFNGIVFFATNLHENYDRAFESRILKHVEFKLPDQKIREKIIKIKLPQKAPYDSSVRFFDGAFNPELITMLAEEIEGFSGRQIKNCILEALMHAAKLIPPKVTSKILMDTFRSKKAELAALKKQNNMEDNSVFVNFTKHELD